MTFRQILRRVLSAAVLPFLIILYFNIENLAARLGWGNILADAFAPQAGASPVVEFLQHPAVLWTALVGLGMAAGMWIDSLLYRRERKPLEEEARRHFIDRVELSKEAEELARQLGALAGHGHARHAIAWQEETEDLRSTLPSVPMPSRSRTARERASVVEKYGEKFHADAWRIINAAGRLIPLDRGDLWRVEHVMISGHGIEEMSAFLMAIANDLRFPNEPLLAHTDRRFMDQAAAAALQSPQGTGSETQP